MWPKGKSKCYTLSMDTQYWMAQAAKDIQEERYRQEEMWGEQNHTLLWISILGEEFGEFCREMNDFMLTGKATPNLRAEMVQCAAVCQAIVECIDRNQWIKE
jgi:hypothetical protein